jgi:hypothetical protein
MTAASSRPAPAVLDAVRDMARERPVAVTVRGTCMEPLLLDGDRVEVAPARVYWPGDLLAFQAADGRLLVHRLLGYRPYAGRLACVTRGDACPHPDAPVPLDRLLGRVRAVEGRSGLLVSPAARVRAVLAWLGLAARRLRRT